MVQNRELTALLERYPQLAEVQAEIHNAYSILENSFAQGGKLLLCGNGGSAADSDHIAGELLKGFKLPRKISRSLDFSAAGAQDDAMFYEKLQGGLPAISLCGHPAYFTAWCNDVQPDMVFAQQVYALAREHDTLLALSTSGNSQNVVNAVITAKAKGIHTVAMTGTHESRLSDLCDCCIPVPSGETFRVQEYHLPIYHALCAMLEERFFRQEELYD